MKKIFAIMILVVACMTVVLAGCTTTDETLYVLNWGDYIDESLLAEYEAYYLEETGKTLTVVYNTADTNESIVNQVIDTDSAARTTMNLDVACPSEYGIQKLVERGIVADLGSDKERLWNGIYSIVTDGITEAFDGFTVGGKAVDLTDYLVPYMWGTVGIMYNTEKVTEADLQEGWGLLWNSANNPELNGKIYMKDSIRDAYVAAVMRLKELNKLPQDIKDAAPQQLINTINSELLALTEEILIEQKAVVMGYDVDFDKEEMVAGNAYVDLAWSGDAVYSIYEAGENGVSLDFYIPESGSNIWFDGWVIPKKAQNPEAAKAFVEFMNMPENAMRNMIYIGYTTSLDPALMKGNEDVLAVLEENEMTEEDIFENEVQYYTGTAPLGVMRDFGTNEAMLINMWERVKVSGNNPWVLVIIIVGIAVFIGGLIVLFVLRKNKSGKRRKVA